MRNLFYYCLICCFYNVVAFCQNITEKDIAGNWKMAGFELSGIKWDFTTDVLKLPQELEKETDPTTVSQLKESLKPYKEGHVYIKPGNIYEQVLMGETITGSYSLIKEGNDNYLKITTATTKSTELIKLKISNGRMYISIPADDGSSTLFYFSRSN